jgi:serine protease Do
MKTPSSKLITIGLVAMLVSSAFALEAPADDSPAPAQRAKAAADASASQPLHFEPLPGEKKIDETPSQGFLGIVTVDVPDILAEHLDLRDGIGIVVRSLMPNGPAVKAGISVNDVITQAGDQVIQTPEDISKWVASQKPGSKVAFKIIHKGQPTTIDVILGTRPAEVASAGSVGPLNLDEFPKDVADRIRAALQNNGGGLGMGGMIDSFADTQLKDVMRHLKEDVNPDLKAGNSGGSQFEMSTGSTLRVKDDQGSVEFKSSNNHKEVTIRDRVGKVTWTGPWDTDQDKASAPAEVSKRLEILDIDHLFKNKTLNLQQGFGPAIGP